MAPHSSTLAWKIQWMEGPGRLQSMGSRRVGHDFIFTFTFHFHALEKEMATHSSVLAWRIPGMGKPGGLPSMGLHRAGHDCSDLAAAAAAAAAGLVLWKSRVLDSVLPVQRLRAWSQVLRGSIYSFLLVRYSCLLSTGILHALLCLSEGVFLMYPWREMYSMITYSSTIFFHFSFSICCLGWS